MINPFSSKSRRRSDVMDVEESHVGDNRDLVAFFDKARSDQERNSILRQAERRAQRDSH